jgi:hypothetical protein
MTRINPNDPKWTAYVLGELDKAESEAVERLLESSEEARGLVEDLRTASVALAEALDEAPVDLLTPAQRASVRQAADAQTPRWFAMLPMRWALGAASVAVIAIAVSVVVRMPEPARQAAVESVQRGVPETPATSAVANQPAPVLPEPPAARPQVVVGLSRQASPADASKQVEMATPSAPSAPSAAPVVVGRLAETITVTGEAPAVDVANTRQLAQAVSPPVAAPAVAVAVAGVAAE